MEVPEAMIDAPVVVINPVDTGMGPQDVEAPLPLSPAEALILRIINDIEALYPPGSIMICSNRHWVLVDKVDVTEMAGSISMGHREGNNVHVHFPKEILHPFLIHSRTGQPALPFGWGLISLGQTGITLSFQLDVARYNQRRADILGLFKFVLDLHETGILGLGDFAGELNAELA
jgi:hypothetical protein